MNKNLKNETRTKVSRIIKKFLGNKNKITQIQKPVEEVIPYEHKSVSEYKKVSVTFRTEFPLFFYNKTFYLEDEMGISDSDKIFEDIMDVAIKPAMAKYPKEVKRFYETYKNASYMINQSIITCRIKKGEEEFPEESLALSINLTNKLYEELTPQEHVKTVKDLQREYFMHIFDFVKTAWKNFATLRWA